MCCCSFFCCVQCAETFVYFVCAHSTPRALAYVNAQPQRHGVIKRTIRGSLARSWPPPLPRRRRRCVLLLLLLLDLSAAAANNRCAVLASSALLCACSRTYGACLRELGEWHASCDILLSLLLQLRLLVGF